MGIKEYLKHWYNMVFRRKQYDKEMRAGLLSLFEDLTDSDEDHNEIENYSVNDLLDKISKKGVKSLTSDEKLFLDKSSTI